MPADAHRGRRAVLISAYDAHSHAQWARGLVAHAPAFDWQRIALAPRYFAWRVRGSALSLLDARHAGPLAAQPELLVATSMLDLAAAAGMVPGLAGVPALVYFHENQFAYPAAPEGLADIQLISIKTALAARRVAFNSAFNRDTFLHGAATLLGRMPDAVPTDLLERIAARSTVLPVPLADDLPSAAPPRGAAGPLRLVWNHRWEHDKAPERLLAALRRARAAGAAFELHLCGPQFRRRPPAFDALLGEFGDVVHSAGFIADRAAYLELLGRMDVVVSTALHDFQGLAVQEATACGCLPLVPDRLAYREFLPASCRYPSWPDDTVREADALAAALVRHAADRAAGRLAAPPALEHLRWGHMEARYQALLEATATRMGA